MTDEVIFLGTGDSMGVPRIYCDCEVCVEARRTGRNRRYRSSILLRTPQGELQIDCGPDWITQMEQSGRREMKHLLVTHAHFDHIGGLPEWVDACRWTGEKGRLYAPAEVIHTIRAQFPWLENHLVYEDITEGFQLFGWSFTPFRVCHGKNGYSYAYRCSKNGFEWVYCPDSIRLSYGEKVYLAGLRLLILGTNFYHEEAAPETRSVYDMVEALELIEEMRPERVIFTHMGHGVDLDKAYPLPSHVTLARTGMKEMIHI